MSYMLGFFLLFAAVGIIFKVKALIVERNRPRMHYHYSSNKKKSISQPAQKFLALIVVLLVFIIGYTLDKTYYNHYLLTFLFMSLGIVWIFSVSVAASLTSEGRKAYYTTGWRSEIFLTISGLALIGLSLLLYPLALESLTGLVTEPILSSGIVERKSTGNGGRLGPLFYVTIEDERYKVLDYGWWQSINQGDQISFAYNGQAEFDNSIFQPEKISFSASGILVSGIGGVLWLVTIGIALNGYKTLFSRKQNDYELPIYNDSYAQQSDSLVIKAGAERKRSSIVWVIGGGLLTILIVAWRIFRRAAKSS